MADETNKKKLYSKAEWFTFAGFFVFIILTYIGLSFNHSIIESAFYTVLIAVIGFAVLKILIRIKAAETRVLLWRIVEGVLCALLLAGFLVLGNRPMYKAMSVYSSGKTVLQPNALKDLDSLEHLFEVYEQQERNAILEVYSSLTQVTGLSSSRFDETATEYLNCFFGSTSLTDSKIENYRHLLEARFLSLDSDGVPFESEQVNDYQTFKQETLDQTARIRAAVSSWSLWMVPRFASSSGRYSIQELCTEVPEILTDISHIRHPEGYHMKFLMRRSPTNTQQWTIADEALEYTYPVVTCAFAQRLDGFSTIWTIVLGLLVNGLMAFIYFMAYRSSKKSRKRSKKDKYDIIGGGRL